MQYIGVENLTALVAKGETVVSKVLTTDQVVALKEKLELAVQLSSEYESGSKNSILIFLFICMVVSYLFTHLHPTADSAEFPYYAKLGSYPLFLLFASFFIVVNFSQNIEPTFFQELAVLIPTLIGLYLSALTHDDLSKKRSS